MSEEEIIERAIAILEARLKTPSEFMTGSNEVKGYLKLHFAGLEYESFRIMFLDAQHGMIAFKELFRGTIDSATVYPREVVKAALEFNAAAVVFAHNHPSGNCVASEADKQLTRKLINALDIMDIRVLDHVIVGGSTTLSFAEQGLLR